MYRLYHNKETRELRVEPIGKLMINTSKITDEVSYYNSNYFVCNNRKILKQKAEEILYEWIREIEKELIEVKDIKIISKY